jgi:NADH:ubiquinone oxidoreductase subunit D
MFRQTLNTISNEPIKGNNKKLALSLQAHLKQLMKSLINYFKVYTKEIIVPMKKIYTTAKV